MSEAKKYVWDDRAPSFLQLGDVARAIAEDHAGIDIDDVTYRRWGQLMGLLREFDTMIDDHGIPADEALERLKGFEEFREYYPALSPGVLPEDVQEKLLRRTAIIMHRGEQVAREQSANRFAILRASEGRHTANLFEDSATPHVKEQPGFEASFMPAMRSLGSAATTLDSLLDARQDKRQGKTAIEIDGGYLRHLVTLTWGEGGEGGRALLHPRVLGQFAIMSAVRLRNRLTHGRVPGSSLDIFFR